MPRVKSFDENEVLTKATELFWKKGYFDTSIQDLVEHLGLSRSSIYDTYGGKKELFYKSFAQYRNTNIAGVKEFLASQTSVKNGIRVLFEMGIADSIEDKDRKGCFVVNTATELVPGEPEIAKILKENKAIFTTLFYDFLSKGEESGEIAKGKDLKALANLLFTLFNGIKVVAKMQPNAQELNDIVKTALTLLD